MRFRKLRIAWSVVWGVAVVLLIVLWVRSYWWADRIGVFNTPKLFVIGSLCGNIEIGNHRHTSSVPKRAWEFRTLPLDNSVEYPKPALIGIYTDATGSDIQILMPFWLVTLLVATIATAPWIPRRFSLRTLLIGTTLVAILLGLIAWAAR